MKNLTALITLCLFSNFANANSFNCLSSDGTEAQLTITNEGIYWQDLTHSADSQGQYLGKEDVPYDPNYDYDVFDLINYYRTDGSRFLLKLEPNHDVKSSFQVFVVFDNESHIEEETQFNCKTSN